MIQVIPIHNEKDASHHHLKTHSLSPRPGIHVILTIDWPKESIISILEDHMLENISGWEWNGRDTETDFTFVTEHYNRFIKNLEEKDLEGISLIFWVLQWEKLILSAIGNASAYIVEDEKVSKITSTEEGRKDFHAMTTGNIDKDMTIYLSNIDSQSTLGNGLLEELSGMTSQEFSEVAKNIIQKDIHFPFILVRIAHITKKYGTTSDARRTGKNQIDILRHKSLAIKDSIVESKIWNRTKNSLTNFSLEKSQHKYIFLWVGILISFLLVYSILRGISWAITSITDDSPDKVLQAKTLIEESQKLSGNPEAFEKTIKEAEKILANLREERKYLADTQELQTRIDILKKETYDIQTINLSEKTPILSFSGESNFLPVITREINNKISVIGKNAIISDFIQGSTVPHSLTFPQGENVVDAEVSDNGSIYMITDEKHVLTKKQDTISTVNVLPNGEWEKSNTINAFNGNIYLVSESKNQIFRYRPNANGFTEKTPILPSFTESPILDIAIDGGFYILMENGKIWRFTSSKNEWISYVTLNKVPGVWNIDSSAKSEIINNDKLSYIYILNGKKLWVFQPNSRNFQDITALNYIAQMEIQSNDRVQSISVSRDGYLLVTTQTGVYEVNFEIIDDKLIIK